MADTTTQYKPTQKGLNSAEFSDVGVVAENHHHTHKRYTVTFFFSPGFDSNSLSSVFKLLVVINPAMKGSLSFSLILLLNRIQGW